MPHVSRYGLISPAPTPTPPSDCSYFFSPPASSHPRTCPDQLEHHHRPHQQQQPQHQHAHTRASPSSRPRFSPVTPEDRLGSFLTGTLQLTGILGIGAYGVVYSAEDAKTNSRYAVKCLSKFNPDGTPLDRRQVVFQTREIRLHYHASAHPNVVSMLKIIDNPDCIYVILEYCPEGDLFFNITERGQYVGKDELARSVFLQILDAVEFCHSQGIYHRDLKPENILVQDNGKTVKLADFGLATSADRSEDYGCGSTFYMSPECLDHSSSRPYYMCAPNDVWSLGVVLVNLTCGRNPWRQASFEDSTYRAYAKSRDFLKTILPVSDELNDILSLVFQRNPEQRISLAELRRRISACPHFTVKPQSSASLCIPKPGPIAPLTAPQQQQPIFDTASRLKGPTPSGAAPLSPAPSRNSWHADDGTTNAAVDAHGLHDDDHVAAAPLSPAPSDLSMSDGTSSADSSSARSTASSRSSVDDHNDDCECCDLVEDDGDDCMPMDMPDIKTPPPEVPAYQHAPIIYEAEHAEALAHNRAMPPHLPLECPVMPRYTGPMPGTLASLSPLQQQLALHHQMQLVVPSPCCLPAVAPMSLPSPPPLHHGCAPWGDMFGKAMYHDGYQQPHQPQLYHPVPLCHQPFPFATWQIGCY